jgi:hypothetical protein
MKLKPEGSCKWTGQQQRNEDQITRRLITPRHASNVSWKFLLPAVWTIPTKLPQETSFLDAIDVCQDAAVASGLAASVGMDVVQAVMGTAFAHRRLA